MATRLRYVVPLVLIVVTLAVILATGNEHETDPQVIIDRAIAAHGGAHLVNAVVEFDFRGKHFTVTRNGGLFTYERTYTDSTGLVREVLSNDELYRSVAGVRVPLTEKERLVMQEAINSVVYFALLPFPLNDPAVQKRYVGETRIEGAPYDEVEITFRKEGGGRDYQDRFVYWIHQEHATMDYFAYYYYTSEQGSRFRKAVNPRTVGGVRFADYLNYKSAADTLGTTVEHYEEVIAAGGLELVSEIRLDNITVRPLPS
jgi:hypothetical protein